MNLFNSTHMVKFRDKANLLITNSSRYTVYSNLNEIIELIEEDKDIIVYLNNINSKFNEGMEVEKVLTSYGTKTFNIGSSIEEIIINSYKLIKYIVKYNISISLIGRSYSSSNNDDDIINGFINAIVKPFIDYLITYILQRGEIKVKRKFIERIFIVHGHDNEMKLELKNYLQNTLMLPEPIILSELPNHGLTIIEKFEEATSEADLVFVLLTPDDFTYNSTTQARQNVILELGYFMGKLGRKSGRVIILFKNKNNFVLPSDLNGVGYIDVQSHIEAIGESIRKEICNLTEEFGE